jgi:hypothetical protein
MLCYTIFAVTQSRARSEESRRRRGGKPQGGLPISRESGCADAGWIPWGANGQVSTRPARRSARGEVDW